MKKLPVLFACLPVTFLCISSVLLTRGPWRDMSNKEAFDKAYPRYYIFRGEMKRDVHKDYDVWNRYFGDASGVIRKFVPEELYIVMQTQNWIDRYAEKNPEKLVMLHLNGQARQVSDYPEVLKRYFPGHWVYDAGSRAESDLGASERTVKVSDVVPFTGRGYVNRNTKPFTYLPTEVIIVRLGKDGSRLWYESEYATLTGVDKQAGTITLDRGQYHTRPLDFKAGKTYIAPVAGTYMASKIMWYYNLSDCCPADRDGQKAWEAYADEIIGWFSSDGPLRNVQGIAFDVNYFDVSEKNRNWDTDNDGTVDNGWIGGRNLWREGDWKFLCRLKESLGSDFIVTGDGQHPTNQQAVGVLDGIESEGLVQHNDMWRGFSRALNTHLYWQENNTSPYDFRYVVLKLGPEDEPDAVRLRRFGAAVSFCLEAGVTEQNDRDYIPELFRAPGSLGRAQGRLVRYARTTPEKLTFDAEALASRIECGQCRISVAGDKVVVHAAASGGARNIILKIKNIPLPAGDVTFFVNARAIDPLERFTPDDRVPRAVWLRPEKLPDYGEGQRLNEYYTNLYGFAGTRRTESLSYYFRNVEAGTQDIEVTIQGTGAFEIGSFELYDAPDIVARRFDNGIIVANPSFENVEIDVSVLFPGVAGVPGPTVVPAVDAVFIAR